MSALYGRLHNEQGKESTRCAHRSLVTKAETWNGIIRVELDKDGTFVIELMGKQGERKFTLASGNVDMRDVQITPYFPNEGIGAWSIDAETIGAAFYGKNE